MANTSLTEPKQAPVVTFTELNVRQDKGKPHFVRLHDSVVKELEKYLRSASGDSSGLLLGSIDVGENCTISVADFEPAIIEDIVRSKNIPRVVGYYRSYSHAEIVPDDADRSLFQRIFPKEPRLLLLVRPPKTDIGTAMFFLGENGLLMSDRATVEFPFNLQELGAEDPSPAPAAAPAPVVAKPAGSTKPVSVVKAAAPATKTPPPISVAKPVAQDQASGGGWFWKIAVAGVVIVGSGLGLNFLGVFNPQSSSPVVVDNPAPVVREPQPAPVPQETGSGSAEPRKETPPTALKAAAVEPSSKKPAPAVAAAPAEATPAPLPTPIERPPAIRSQAPAPTPPAAEPKPAATTPAPPVREQITEQAPPAATRPVPVNPPVQSAKPPVSEPVRTYVAPRAIRQIAPVLVDRVRRSIEGEMAIKVRAYVDATGKVTRIEPLTGGSPVADALAATAINAVKRWQFEPARRGNENVAGDVELNFTFRK